jgi:hypothetical protein
MSQIQGEENDNKESRRFNAGTRRRGNSVDLLLEM